MGRPRKPIGNYKDLACNTCGKDIQEGFRLTLEIRPAEVTEDFFIEYDSNTEEYDAYFCSSPCILKYILEVFKDVRGS